MSTHQRTRTITLEVPELDLAHLWANKTWDGKEPLPLESLILGEISNAAKKHRNYLRQHAREIGKPYDELAAATMRKFQAAHPDY